MTLELNDEKKVHICPNSFPWIQAGKVEIKVFELEDYEAEDFIKDFEKILREFLVHSIFNNVEDSPPEWLFGVASLMFNLRLDWSLAMMGPWLSEE